MQQEMNYMELAKILLQFAVLPIIAFMWAHYKMTQNHDTEIAVMKSEHALVKENHDREFKELRESLKSVLSKLDEIQKDLRK
jgi:hypothetical protein